MEQYRAGIKGIDLSGLAHGKDKGIKASTCSITYEVLWERHFFNYRSCETSICFR
jgi:hypothetical protein